MSVCIQRRGSFVILPWFGARLCRTSMMPWTWPCFRSYYNNALTHALHTTPSFYGQLETATVVSSCDLCTSNRLLISQCNLYPE
jgi:hypothetical protein